jgi:hypothetical protein
LIKTGILLIGGIALAAAAFVHAASEVDPLGLGMATNTGTGLSANAMTEFVSRASLAQLSRQPSDDRAESQPLSDSILSSAYRAFSVDPFHASTIRAIALGSIIQSDREQARQAMRAAWDLSKRDDITTAWLAQDYGQLGDLSNMIAFLDSSLRTSRRARDIAVKPLADLLVHEEAHRIIGNLLADGPEWETAFWQEFVQNPVALQNATQFFTVNSLTPQRLRRSDRERLYANLKRSGQIAALYRLASIDPDVQSPSSALTEGRFPTNNNLNPLDWTLNADGLFATRVLRENGQLELDVRPDSSGTAAERIIRFNGPQQLSITLEEPLSEGVNLDLVATCAIAPTREIARISLERGQVKGATEVSAGECMYGNLALKFRTGSSRGGSVLRIVSISMAPAGS